MQNKQNMIHKLSVALIVLFSIFSFSAFSQEAQIALQPIEKKWSAGLRTGAYNQNNVFPFHYNDKNRTIFHNQIFVNRYIGAKKKFMIETNLGYANTTASFETKYNVPFKSSEVIQMNNINWKVIGRYKFAQISSLQWHHFVGVFTDVESLFYNMHFIVESSSGTNYGKGNYQEYHLYTGIEYMGKVYCNRKISVQYAMAYNVNMSNYIGSASNILKPLFQRQYEGSIGIGYHFR